uniref:Uncharacterized protein n=1 Tax=Anguilla anguilla TaxID=7936 RepID=A0A0E9S0Y1_ANGAN
MIYRFSALESSSAPGSSSTGSVSHGVVRFPD